MSLSACLALIIALGAVCMDLLWDKVSNQWIFCAWIVGISYQLLCLGIQGAKVYLIGAVLPILLLFPLFFFRMLGAGDIKLFSALGGIIGYSAIIRSIIISFFIGAVFSAAFLLVCGNGAERFHYFFQYLSDYKRTGRLEPYFKRGKQVENIHFTVPILLGMLLYAGGFY